MNAYFDAMRRYASFSGRSTRSQYWLFVLILAVLAVVAMIIDTAMTNDVGILNMILLLAHLLPFWALTVRRLHDAGLSGWWTIVCIIPLIAIIMALLPSSPKGARFDGPTTAGTAIPASAPTSASPVNVEQLERLAALKASGAIDDDEYKKMKAGILGQANS